LLLQSTAQEHIDTLLQQKHTHKEEEGKEVVEVSGRIFKANIKKQSVPKNQAAQNNNNNKQQQRDRLRAPSNVTHHYAP
jgi:hypothetical protein